MHKQYYANRRTALMQYTNSTMQIEGLLSCSTQTVLCKVQGLCSHVMHKRYYAKYKDCPLVQCTNNTMQSTRTVLLCNAQTILCKIQGLCSHAMHKQYYAKYKDCALMQCTNSTVQSTRTVLSCTNRNYIYIYDVGLMINP